MSTLVTKYKGEMLFETAIGNHKVLVEGPKSWGGKELAPMPPQIFFVSISSCVGVLIAHYCKRHDINDDGMSVTIHYEKEEHPSRFSNVRVEIDLPNADLSDDHCQQALLSVAEHCPVNQTITTLKGVEFTLKSCRLTPEL
jgi:uncharacterized OsmC-like protein